MKERLTQNKAELEPGEDRICRGVDCNTILVRGLPLCRSCDCDVYGEVYDSVKKKLAEIDESLIEWLEENYPKEDYIAVFDLLREVIVSKNHKKGMSKQEKYNYTILMQNVAQALREYNISKKDFLKAETELSPKQRRRL